MTEPTEYMSDEEYGVAAAEYVQSDVDRYLGMDVEEFGKLSAVKRDMVLFTLLRDNLGEMRALADLVRRYEEKALAFGDTLKSPDGLSALMGKLPIGGGLMGMLGKGF